MVRLVAASWSFEQILADYPDLERADIQQALEYAAAATDVHEHRLRRPVEPRSSSSPRSLRTTSTFDVHRSTTLTSGHFVLQLLHMIWRVFDATHRAAP